MSAANAFHVDQIAQLALEVQAVPPAVAFYRDVLGLRELPIPAPPTMAFLACGETRFMLSLPEGRDASTPGSLIYFRVSDIHAAHAVLVEHGVDVIRPPHLVARLPDHDLWMTFFRDPSGNPLAFMAEAPREPDPSPEGEGR